MKRLFQWINERLPISNTWKSWVSEYYVPKNLNFYYFFGSLALLVLFIQFITGLWLTMFYTPNVDRAFTSVEYIMRDVNYGWLLRYLHSTGASAFFIIIYIHIFKSLLYGSYQKPRELIWILGVMLFILLLVEAFCGYLLPWGQMSYWGAQVITSLFSTIPYIGDQLVLWLRGDYQIGNASLQRFFALHVIGVPLLLLGGVFLHLIALHKVGSNNPEGIEIKHTLSEQGLPLDGIPLHPYYTIKDLVAVLIFLIIFFTIVFFIPDMGGFFLEKENSIPASTLSTPEHIRPLWYMSPFYAILRAIPSKTLGVIIMIAALILLLLIPWLDNSPVRSMRYKGYYSRCALGTFVVCFLFLGYLGSAAVTTMNMYAARICTFVYFAYFLGMPVYSRYEVTKRVPLRISR